MPLVVQDFACLSLTAAGSSPRVEKRWRARIAARGYDRQASFVSFREQLGLHHDRTVAIGSSSSFSSPIGTYGEEQSQP